MTTTPTPACVCCGSPATTTITWRCDARPSPACNYCAHELRYGRLWRIRNLVARLFDGDQAGEVAN